MSDSTYNDDYTHALQLSFVPTGSVYQLSLPGSLGGADREDWFALAVPASGTLGISLGALGNFAAIELYAAASLGYTDWASRYVARASQTWGMNRIDLQALVTAADYYIRVFNAGEYTNYSLALIEALDYAGNTAATARSVSLGSATQSFSDYIGAADTSDWYVFTTTGPTDFSLQLGGLSSDIDVRLLAADGLTTLGASTRAGTGSESISQPGLGAGTYYVKVYQYSGNSGYTLSLAAPPGAPVDHAGNAIGAARDVGTLAATARSIADWVGATDTQDYYRFNLAAVSDVSIALTGLGANADMALFNAAGSVIAVSVQADTAAESIGRTAMAAGNYYLRVYRNSGDTGYALALSAAASTLPDLAGNSFEQARPLAVAAFAQTFVDHVGADDGVDFYRFSTAGYSNLRLALTGLAADADTALYDAHGNLLASSSNGGNAAEAIAVDNMAAGSYYVCVYQYAGNTNYTLTLSAAPAAAPDGAGNSLAAARAIGPLSAAQTFNDYVGAGDGSDYYRFTLAYASSVGVTLDGMGADANLAILNAQGGSVSSSAATGSAAEQIAANLNAGTYYLRVVPAAGAATAYRLQAAATLTAPAETPNDTTASAADLGTLSAAAATRAGFVGSADQDDYYAFTLARNSDLRLALRDLGADADVTVLSGDGSTILGSSDNGGSNAEAVALNNLAAGRYFVRVYRYAGDTNYTLRLSAAPTPDAAGDSPAAARAVGLLGTTTRRFNEQVGGSDQDYYRFQTAAAANFRLSLEGLSGNADVQLLASDGSTVTATSATAGTAAESIAIDHLAAGSYYVRVYPDAGASTSYALALTAAPAGASDDTWETATALGTLTAAVTTRSDYVGAGDAADYYAFDTSATSNFRLTLSGLSADADVELIDAAGITMAASAAPGNGAESIGYRNLAAGRYYVRVFQYAGNTNYSLSLRADAVVQADGAGNSAAAARAVGTLTATPVQFNDFVNSGDPYDWYRIRLAAAGNFRLVLDGLAADAGVDLIGADGSTIVASGTTTADGVVVLDRDGLAGGSYYVRVAGNGHDTAYRLSLSAQTATDNAGASAAAASDLGVLAAAPRSMVDFVGSADPDDWYRFTTRSTSNFRLNLSGLAADADVALVAADGSTVVAASAAAGSTAESIQRNGLGAGTYYVHVYQYSGNTGYTLGLRAPAVADSAGNTAATARTLALGATPLSVAESVADGDADDYYRFVLTARSEVQFALTGLSGNVDLQLRGGSAGTTVLAASGNPDAGAEAIATTLNPGTYWLRAYQGAAGISGDYTLGARALPAVPTDAAGNTALAARAIGVGATARSFSDYVGDLDAADYYRFALSGLRGLRVQLAGMADAAALELLAADGTVVAASRSSAGSASSPDTLEFDRLAAGTYYLHVAPEGTSAFYTLGVRSVAADDFVAATSTPGRAGTAGTPVAGNLENSGDVDWFAATLDGGTAYTIRQYGQSSANGTLADPAIAGIYDNSGSAVAGTSNDNGNATTRDAWVVFTPTTTGTYYVAAAAGAGQTGSYRLGISSSNQAPTVNNTMATQTAIEGTPWSCILPWNLFTDPEGQALSLSAQLANGHALPAWLAFDAESRSFSGTAPANGEDLNVRITATDPGNAAASAQFQLRTAAGSGDDYAAAATAAGTVALGGSARGNIEVAGDADWFGVALSAGTPVVIDLLGSGGTGGTLVDPYLRGIYDAGGSPIAGTANDDSGASRDARVRFTPQASGNYFIAAGAYGGNTGTYTLRVSTANDAPLVAIAMADREAREGQAFDFQVPLGAFTDPENQSLTYSAALATGAALPAWLRFNADTRSFSGTPPANAPDLAVRVTARDPLGLAVADDFVLRTPSTGSSGGSPAAQARWTVMIYVAADNNLEAAAIDDINEMEQALLPDNVRVVVQVDRSAGTDVSRGYDVSNGNWTDTRRGRIVHDNNTGSIGSPLSSVGETNTGSQQALTDFINWGASNHRADRYALVIWDHGGGLDGTCQDDASGDILTLAETTRAITNSTLGRLDFVGFDACLQSMAEQVADLRSSSDVIVASENPEPGDGWDYTSWLGQLAQNPNATARQLGSAAVATYENFYRNTSDGNSTTLAATDTSRVDELNAAINSFVTATGSATAGDWTALRAARDQSLAADYRPANKDLQQFSNLVAANASVSSALRTAAQGMSAAIDDALFARSALMPDANGLSIFMPSSRAAMAGYTAANYQFLNDTRWRNFLLALNPN